ncbi:MAG: TetR/AcrR family transcriptional regulator [Ruminococcus sp.]|nr:TetR/AcrR family transcriptional regulator [Ruminococcus sp.]
MPPIKKFQKDDIIDITCKIIEEEGLRNVNARRIASFLGSSVQPIFHNFASMEELINEAFKKIYEKYQEYMLSGINKEKPYKEMGLSYIRFAKDYPEFFKMIFMQETNFNAEKFIMLDDLGNDVIKKGQMLSNLSYEEQKKFHIKVWIFTHGIACLVATKTINISDEEIEKLLETTVLEMLNGYKENNK